MTSLNGKVILITGASAGIGRRLVEVLTSDEHAAVVIGCARRLDALEQLQSSLANPSRFTPMQCDVSAPDELRRMFDAIEQRFERLDICICNAGMSRRGSILERSNDDFLAEFQVNVLAACICARDSYRLMRRRGGDQASGHLLFVNSVSGHRVDRDSDFHYYAGTKHMLHAIAWGVRQELRQLKSPIRVTSVCPGVVDTEFALSTYSLPADYREKFEQSERFGIRVLDADDVVRSIVFALTQPAHVEMNDIVLRPIDEED